MVLTQATFQARRCGTEQPTTLTQVEAGPPATPRTMMTKMNWTMRANQMKRSARRGDGVVAILESGALGGMVHSDAWTGSKSRDQLKDGALLHDICSRGLCQGQDISLQVLDPIPLWQPCSEPGHHAQKQLLGRKAAMQCVCGFQD